MERELPNRRRARSNGSKRTRVRLHLGGELIVRIQGLLPAFSTPRREGTRFDVLMAVTIATWSVYASALALRHLAGWRGRRAAYLILAGFVLVAVVRLALPVTHFAT